jgi:hypothetical protein
VDTEPPVGGGEPVARLWTPQGEAAIEVVLDRSSVQPGECVTFRLVNSGQVELITGQPFQVARWDGQAWRPSSSPEINLPGGGKAHLAFTDEGRFIAPGRRTEVQSWPLRGMPPMEPGWYRVAKAAWYEGLGTRDKMVAYARFRVTGGTYVPGSVLV